jgi:lysozyme family protein
MADFLPAFERTMRLEGGYRLHTVVGDRGGMTYAGIARNAWPHWPGWAAIDKGDTPATADVRNFYAANFWQPIHADAIAWQPVAETLYDAAVNMGVTTAVKLAQVVAGSTPDGKFGPKTLAAVNGLDPDKFIAAFALAKVKRYAAIVSKDRSQGRFLLGWINRTLEGLA